MPWKDFSRSSGWSAICLLFCLCMAACDAPRTRPRPDHLPHGWGRESRQTISLENIEAAYAAGNLPLTEVMAAEFTAKAEAPLSQLAEAWRLQALAATENRHPMEALTSLDRWRAASSMEITEEWLEIWHRAMLLLPTSESAWRARSISESPVGHPPALVDAAMLFLLEQRLQSPSWRESLSGLERLYNGEEPARRRYLENRLFHLLHTLPSSNLGSLMAATNDSNENRYPYGLIRLENARRLFWEPQHRNQAKENVYYTKDGSQLANQSLFQSWNHPDWQVLKPLRHKNPALALVLPISGPYGNLSEKIIKGAEVVRNGLAHYGRLLHIYVIDSDNPDWLANLAALPAEARIVGGPLRREDYLSIKDAGLLNKRAYFAFLPNLDEDDEGLYAWRFFPSRQDQVRVMLNYAMDLDLTSYSIFAPDSGEYGRQMFELFYSQAAENEVDVTRAGYYPADQYQLWVKSVSDFLGLQTDLPTNPEPDFQVMFLPDNWSNASRIISHVFYCLDNRILFMGTNLWEHGLISQQRLGLRNYRLTVFPGAWNPQTISPSGGLLRSAAALSGNEIADFWLSLGYDFAIMAAGLNLPTRLADPSEVNAALATLPPLPWSGAPMRWDAHGFGQQDLYVLAPAENGFSLANRERIKTRLNQPLNASSGVTAPKGAQADEAGDHD
ncbi:MAG: hypothetical protein FWG17_05860 [Desulfovibrionaceae bacterium]|nr:hypothetical protein [Desulfovibrionaceae bacterium]